MSNAKTVREWRIELPKIKDVTVIEKAIYQEKEDKNRKTVIVLLQEKLELLTIALPEEKYEDPFAEVENAEVIDSEEIVEQEQAIDAVVLHKEKDILLILNPYQEKLSKMDIDSLTWKDTSDKIGYTNIKNTLKSLSELRRTVDSERKTFNAPYADVISFSNEHSSKLIGEVKDCEDVLKERKKSYEDTLSKEKEEAKQKKAQELFKKQQEEEAAKQKEIEEAKKKIESSDFKQRFGGIINRAVSNIDSKNTPEESNESENPFGDDSNDLFTSKQKQEEPVPLILTDKDILNKKMAYLKAILNLDTPNADVFIKPCSVIDSNVKKIINYIEKNF